MGEQYQVVPRALATQDLREAAAHLAAEVDAATARRFIDAVEQAFELLARQPGIGSPRYALELDWPGLRTHPVQRFPYLIFYVEQTNHLDVLARVGAGVHRSMDEAGSVLRAGRGSKPRPPERGERIQTN